jgi:hypothetical protein
VNSPLVKAVIQDTATGTAIYLDLIRQLATAKAATFSIVSRVVSESTRRES